MINEKECSNVYDKDSFDGSFLFPEDGFEDKTSRTEYCKTAYSAHNNKFYFDTKNNSIYPQYTKYRSCPLCSSDLKELVFVKGGFQHVKCRRCHFLYVDPILNEEAMSIHYKGESEWTKVMLNSTEREINRKMYEYTLNVVSKYSKQAHDVLDVGAGAGHFVEIVKEKGFNAKGIEINERMIERAAGKGMDISNETIATLKKNNAKYGLITFWAVLEHIPDPVMLIGEIKDLLEEQGLIFIMVPNIDSIANRLYCMDSPTFLGSSHINFFNIDFLNELVCKQGYSLLNVETYITQLNNIKKYFKSLGLTENSGLNKVLKDLMNSKMRI